MLKLDISKAYDLVDWNFPKHILELFGFPNSFVKLIMACISITKFSVLLNSELEEFFWK
ncbi:unnamed protein product [Rhodiola kirilowii]